MSSPDHHHNVYVILLDAAVARPPSVLRLNPLPHEAAAQMEQDLANDLRAQGHTVTGGT